MLRWLQMQVFSSSLPSVLNKYYRVNSALPSARRSMTKAAASTAMAYMATACGSFAGAGKGVCCSSRPRSGGGGKPIPLRAMHPPSWQIFVAISSLCFLLVYNPSSGVSLPWAASPKGGAAYGRSDCYRALRGVRGGYRHSRSRQALAERLRSLGAEFSPKEVVNGVLEKEKPG